MPKNLRQLLNHPLIASLSSLLDLVGLARAVRERFVFRPNVIQSDHPEYTGPCVATWLDSHEESFKRQRGMCGYFRQAYPVGLGLWLLAENEFHGFLPAIETPTVRRSPNAFAR